MEKRKRNILNKRKTKTKTKRILTTNTKTNSNTNTKYKHKDKNINKYKLFFRSAELRLLQDRWINTGRRGREERGGCGG